jgi:hypothetical protein
MMHRVARGDDHAVRARIGGAIDRIAQHAVSTTALRLHAQALLASFEDGHPGFVADRYLAALPVTARVAAAELCLAGVWERAERGYRVIPSEAARMADEVSRQFEQKHRE